MLKVREEKRRGDLEQVDVVLVTRVCHLVWWQLCKLPLRLPLPDLATVDSLLEILLIVNHV